MDKKKFRQIEEWVQDFIDGYLNRAGDEDLSQNLRLKAEHTFLVDKNIIRLCEALSLDEEQTHLARTIALCHDLGRFPQFYQYRTFRDADSVNHGILSSEIVESSGILRELPDTERQVIIKSIRFHNSVKTPSKFLGDEITDSWLYISLIRDADKLDIWRVFSEYFRLPVEKRPSGAILGLTDDGGVSDGIIEAIREKRVALLKDVKSQSDFRLLQVSWVFDLNFRESFRILKDRDYLSAITDINNEKVQEAVSFVEDYIERRLNSKVYFIGAGPGDPELLTLKGKMILDSCDVVIYAGSLINPEILRGLDAECYDSSGMNLDEIIEKIRDSYNRAKMVVRLHSGDVSLYSAMNEQIARLKDLHIPFEVIPGVSSFQAGAAILNQELTIPELSQTVILTRLEGRTPVPCNEKLSVLAKHRATMVVFLSVGMIERVKDELLKGYPEDTPVVIIEKATWPEQRIIRGELRNLDSVVKEAGIKKTALIYVGESLRASARKESRLYDKDFKHEFRNN